MTKVKLEITLTEARVIGELIAAEVFTAKTEDDQGRGESDLTNAQLIDLQNKLRQAVQAAS